MILMHPGRAFKAREQRSTPRWGPEIKNRFMIQPTVCVHTLCHMSAATAPEQPENRRRGRRDVPRPGPLSVSKITVNLGYTSPLMRILRFLRSPAALLAALLLAFPPTPGKKTKPRKRKRIRKSASGFPPMISTLFTSRTLSARRTQSRSSGSPTPKFRKRLRLGSASASEVPSEFAAGTPKANRTSDGN